MLAGHVDSVRRKWWEEALLSFLDQPRGTAIKTADSSGGTSAVQTPFNRCTMRKILLCAAIAATALMGSPATSLAQRAGVGARINSWLGGGGYGGYGGVGTGAWLNQGLGLYSGYGNYGYGSGLYGRGYGSYYGSPYGYGSYWGSPYYGGSYYGSPYYGGTYYGGAYYANPYYGSSYGFQPSYNYGQQMTYGQQMGIGQQMGYGQQAGASTSGYTPGAQPEFAHPQAVNLQVMVPENATLWIEGQKVDATGPVRMFYSTPLKEGQTYTYHLKARWTDENGKPVERTKEFDVHAGARMAVNFMQPDQDQDRHDRDLNRRDLNRQDRNLNRENQDLNRKDQDLNRKDKTSNRKDLDPNRKDLDPNRKDEDPNRKDK
jgi:uncharacterized protein (TIGR03000 family)